MEFLSDGGEDLRNVQLYLNPEAEHLLDWFHLTMRLTVLLQQRNICEHFAEETKPLLGEEVGCYELFGYEEAKKALQQIHRELMGVNDSPARSLKEGLEETLTLHQLKVPAPLHKTLRTTNPIEPVSDTVLTSCGNMKRWRPGDQRERWICAGLLFAERKFRRIHVARRVREAEHQWPGFDASATKATCQIHY